ncbi:unnamed protein product, partial [Arctogadus glacialis]
MECHAAVCQNVNTVAVQGVKCTLCNRSFKSKRGVSIHMRSAHTAVYVAQQMEKTGGRGAQGRRYGRWSVEETRFLQAHIDKWGMREGFIESACAVIPDRTKDQIKYKVRRLLKLAQAPVIPDSIIQINAELQDLTIEPECVPLYALSTVRKRILQALAKGAGSGSDGWAGVSTESETLDALVDLAEVVKRNGRLNGSGKGRRRITVRKAANALALNHMELQELFKLNRSKVARVVLD